MRITAGAGAPVDYALERNDDLLPTQHGRRSRSAATRPPGAPGPTPPATRSSSSPTPPGYGQVDQRALRKGADGKYTLTVERDAAGRVTRRTETIDGGAPITRAYTYDAQGRLTRVADGADATVEAYAYDADGNRTSANSARPRPTTRAARRPASAPARSRSTPTAS